MHRQVILHERTLCCWEMKEKLVVALKYTEKLLKERQGNYVDL